MNKKLSKDEMRSELYGLLNRYNSIFRCMRYEKTSEGQDKYAVSEETIRSWINELLGIFGWDVKDTNYVLQEYVLRGEEHRRLKSIDSKHRRPDYVLKNGTNIKAFLDAKSLDVNICTDTSAAYQIRSYGWSAQVPCSFLTNFEQFAIFDTQIMPRPDQPVNYGATIITIDEYIEKFDILYEHLCYDLVCSNHLDEIYASRPMEGKNRVDEEFSSILSEYRLKIGKNLLEENPGFIRDNSQLNYYTQIILDRIIFIRVCESKGIEEQEKLKKLSNSQEGFWNAFKSGCHTEFYNHYDGSMFAHDRVFQSLNAEDSILNEFIERLYYPYPYCFDVIPVKVIANIYEEFLGNRLEMDGVRVKAVVKEEYVRTNGAVCTPEYIVDMICRQTLALKSVRTVEELFAVKILEPCCGSGIFLISCYEMLAEKLLDILENTEGEDEKHPDLSVVIDGTRTLTIGGRRAIVRNCLYAVDCDESAVEVTMMSLSLKIVDGNNPLVWKSIGAYGEKILQDVAQNIRLGNTLVEMDGSFTGEETAEIKPFNIRKEFEDVFGTNGGFTYVIGNPPYVETKHYKAALPVMHTYLRNKYKAFEGKADLAVLFIERCLELLSPDGFLGMIVQRRWFKTNYGRMAREIINKGGFLYRIIDFKANDIFKGRITYVSIMVLRKCYNKSVQYYCDADDGNNIRTAFENSTLDGHFEGCTYQVIPLKKGEAIWNFEKFALEEIKDSLAGKWGTLKDYPGIEVKDGIQALWKKMYHLKNVSFTKGIATGYNGFGEEVVVEEDVLRAVIYNRVFYPFKDVKADAYSIFPYYGASTDVIPYEVIRQKYPLLYKYLENNREKITGYVKCREGNMWHSFTREHNHSLYNVDKIIVPMTAKDTIATYIEGRGLYMDNANVWFICSERASKAEMKALTCLINSTVFSVLGKIGANPQSGDYYKFNKQFLTPIPVPVRKFVENTKEISALAALYDEIADLQNRYIYASPLKKEVFARGLKDRWSKLDTICNDMYELSESGIESIMAEGRSVDRVALLNWS